MVWTSRGMGEERLTKRIHTLEVKGMRRGKPKRRWNEKWFG